MITENIWFSAFEIWCEVIALLYYIMALSVLCSPRRKRTLPFVLTGDIFTKLATPLSSQESLEEIVVHS
jgi:hypothetical protein